MLGEADEHLFEAATSYLEVHQNALRLHLAKVIENFGEASQLRVVRGDLEQILDNILVILLLLGDEVVFELEVRHVRSHVFSCLDSHWLFAGVQGQRVTQSVG